MPSSLSFTRWAIAAVAAAVILTGILIISPVGQFIGVRLAPGLPFRIMQVGQNNDRILYRNELTPIQWDLSPENAAAYPGETIALCPPVTTRLHRTCSILAHYLPNNGQAVVFTPPIVATGRWNLVLQAWTVANSFVATGPSAAVPVTVADRGVVPPPKPGPATQPPAAPSPEVPTSDQCPPGAYWCPTPLPPPTPVVPAPSPVRAPSPLPSPVLSPTPTPSPFVPAHVTLLEPAPGTVLPPGAATLTVRLQRFLGSAPGLTCESWRLQQPDGTVTTLPDAAWRQAPARLAPPCTAL